MSDYDALNYYGTYDDYCEPKDVPYEVYQSEINEKDREIEQLENQIEELEGYLEEYRKLTKDVLNEVREYEKNIYTKIKEYSSCTRKCRCCR